MPPAANRAEQTVARLARRSFLALWSHTNPRGRNGKELCDVLAVCDPHVVIFSVKNLALPDTGSVHVDWQRWHRGAIEESVKQIYGAERWLRTATNVVRANGSLGLALPDLSRRRVHRIAVALGSSGSAPLYMGDFGKGFVHVLAEDSLDAILVELDTVNDLVAYLSAKEEFLRPEAKVVLQGSEKDLLAMYLTAGRQLSPTAGLVVLDDGIWEHFSNRPEYIAKKEADRESYVWDKIVDRISMDVLQGQLEFGTEPGALPASELNSMERGLRVMARENRVARRILGRAFKEFLDLSRHNEVRARFVQSPSNVGYVFLATPRGFPREVRTAELGNRCFVARGLHPDISTVVGVATEQYGPGMGFSLDLVCLHIPQWTAEQQRCMIAMQAELRYFTQPRESRSTEDEYPNVGASSSP